LPGTERVQIRNNCREYCVTVLDEEWPAMNNHQPSAAAWKSYYSLWDKILGLRPATQWESNIQQGLIEAIQGLGENRRSRIAELHNALPTIKWVVVFSGAAIIIMFTYFLAASNIWVQALVTALVCDALCLNMLLLSLYSHPFSGDLQI